MDGRHQGQRTVVYKPTGDRYTELSTDQLQQLLKQIEAETGRTPEQVTIDLDLMQYDEQRYHEKDWQRPYVTSIINDIL